MEKSDDISVQIEEINKRLAAIELEIKELLILVRSVVAPRNIVIGF